MALHSVTYVGQDVTGWESIGTVDFNFPITPDMDIEKTVAELQRCLGSDVFLYLFKKCDDDDG